MRYIRLVRLLTCGKRLSSYQGEYFVYSFDVERFDGGDAGGDDCEMVFAR